MPLAEQRVAALAEHRDGLAGPAAARGSEVVRAGVPRVLHGWGRTSPSRARVISPASVADVEAVLAVAPEIRGGLIARGAGRSYGDAAQNGGGAVLDATALRGIDGLDAEHATVRAGAGTTLAELVKYLLPFGFTLPVMPGTKQITVGGAIAADVHGKNHHCDGSFGEHVRSLTLCTPALGTLALSREADPELFAATLGGMGLTGVVVEATLDLEPLPSTELWADIDRTEDLDGALALLAQCDRRHRYAIAWVDLLAGGSRRERRRPGRSVVVRSGYAPAGAGDGSQWSPAPISERPRLGVPRWTPGGLLNPPLVRAFNELRWRTVPDGARERPLDFNSHFFPLDAVANWNRLYGAGGLVQYQFVVPRGREEALLEVAGGLQLARIPMYLVVLKRLGAGSGGPLSFPLDGYTLAIDIPARAPGLRPALRAADEMLAQAGGRVYLAKDSCLREDSLAAMYPALERFGALRAKADPNGLLRSDLARRVGL